MSLNDLFPNQKLVILDGGTGTTLADELGAELDADLWSSSQLVDQPDKLCRLHRTWEEAGADIVMSCRKVWSLHVEKLSRTLMRVPYQASLQAFENFLSRNPSHASKQSDQTVKGSNESQAPSPLDLLRSSVGLAHSSLSKAKLGLSLGPFGATLVPPQDYAGIYPSPHDQLGSLMDFHFERLLHYATDESTWRKVDLVVFETLPNLLEVKSIRVAWDKLTTVLGDQYPEGANGLRWWIKPWVLSFVFAGPNGQFASDNSATQVLEAAFGSPNTLVSHPPPRPSGIGINCTKLGIVKDIISTWNDEFDSPSLHGYGDSRPWLWIYPDGGMVYNVETRSWIDGQTGIEQWARQAMQIAQQAMKHWPGVVVGGCCKTGPAHIRALKCLQPSSKNDC